MSFDWRPESKDRYFRKAEAAVKAAGFDDILRVDKDQFSIVKGTVKVHFKPISRDGKTRRWWEAKRTIEQTERVKNKHDPSKQLRICMKCLRQKTSSAGNTRAFSFTPT